MESGTTDNANTGFQSILFEHPSDDRSDGGRETPDLFEDLRFSNIVSAITSGKEKEEYDIPPLFSKSLLRTGAIEYRHEVFRDLQDPKVLERIGAFAQKMRTMRSTLEVARTSRYKEHAQAWFLESVLTYCDAVVALAEDLSSSGLASRGLIALRDYLQRYRAEHQAGPK